MYDKLDELAVSQCDQRYMHNVQAVTC